MFYNIFFKSTCIFLNMFINFDHNVTLKEWRVAIEKVETGHITFEVNETKIRLLFKTRESMNLNLEEIIDISKKVLEQSQTIDRESCIGALEFLKEKAMHLGEKNIAPKQWGPYLSNLLFFGYDIQDLEKTIRGLQAPEIEDAESRDVDEVDTDVLVLRLFEMGESDKELELTKTILKNLDKLPKSTLSKFKEFLFNSTLFKRLMAQDNANELYDYLSLYLDNEELNRNRIWMQQVLDFAFSSKRYQEKFLQDEAVSQEHLREVSGRSTFKNLDTRQFSNHPKYEAWIAERMAGSTTLKEHSKGGEKARFMWKIGEKKRADSAIVHRSNRQRFTLGTMQLFHKKIAKDEEGVEAGVLRSQSKTIVRAGGDWTHIFCPPGYLNTRLEEFETWMNRELEKCDKGEKNPILLATQTYQRIVTLHPFENANGRVARMMMDYVLERYELPPALLGKDVLDAHFNLSPLNQNHEELLNKVVIGIEKSRRALEEMM